jgi:hypothetical protein
LKKGQWTVILTHDFIVRHVADVNENMASAFPDSLHQGAV